MLIFPEVAPTAAPQYGDLGDVKSIVAAGPWNRSLRLKHRPMVLSLLIPLPLTRYVSSKTHLSNELWGTMSIRWIAAAREFGYLLFAAALDGALRPFLYWGFLVRGLHFFRGLAIMI
jgi:hypothetical protein